MSAELRLPEISGPFVVPAIKSIINNSRSRRPGGRPIKVFSDVESLSFFPIALTIAKDSRVISLDDFLVIQ